MTFPTWALSQVSNGESQEIPLILMSTNEIRDFSFKGLRNFVVTNSGVVDVQRLPVDILRIKVTGSGTTLIFIWDVEGRKTLQIEVTGLASNQITSFRPGYDPAGNEFIYRTTMNNQFTQDAVISPFWNHEFSSSVPLSATNEWRTLLRASTIEQSKLEASNYLPFSNSTILDQFLSYYQTPDYTASIGDINYNAGELSLTGFPLRGASFQLYSSDRQDQFQVFGGANRPNIRTADLFSDPAQNLYGVAGTKNIFPNVSIKSSLVYLDQAGATSIFSPTPYESDFVGDIVLQARPFSDKINFEAEYAQSKDGNSTRILGEYLPFWGRVLASHKTVSKDYINPASFFLQRNFTESNFITDFKPTRKLGLTLNYQLNQFKEDPDFSLLKNTVHRVQLSSLYQVNEETSYLSGLSVSRSGTDDSSQDSERADFTYQRFFLKSQNQFFAQFFGQHLKNNFLGNSTERFGGGTDLRYTKNFSKTLQIYLQNNLQMNYVQSSFSIFSSSPNFVETVASIGPTINFTDRKKTISSGFFETLSFRDSFGQLSHLIQPFFTSYYNLNLALSLGARINLNMDLSNKTTFVAAIGELVYRFGSRVPDTLFSGLAKSAQITGIIFIDENTDGQYQSSEKIITDYTVQINDQDPELINSERFVVKTNVGPVKLTIELPKEYQGYQFATSNPTFLDLYPRETKSLSLAILQRIPLHGKVIVQDEENKPVTEKSRGLEDVKIEITGDNFSETVETLPSGVFNTFVSKPGKYFAKIKTIDLPRGYKYNGPSKIEFTVQEGKVISILPFIVSAKRMIIGRVFFDKNGNSVFDEDDQPIKGIKVKIGTATLISEEDGSFSTASLPAGSYDVKVEPKTYQGFNSVLFSDTVNIPNAGNIEINVPFQK